MFSAESHVFWYERKNIFVYNFKIKLIVNCSLRSDFGNDRGKTSIETFVIMKI